MLNLTRKVVVLSGAFSIFLFLLNYSKLFSSGGGTGRDGGVVQKAANPKPGFLQVFLKQLGCFIAQVCFFDLMVLRLPMLYISSLISYSISRVFIRCDHAC